MTIITIQTTFELIHVRVSMANTYVTALSIRTLREEAALLTVSPDVDMFSHEHFSVILRFFKGISYYSCAIVHV